MQTLKIDGKYGVAIDGSTIKPITFTLREPSTTAGGSDVFYVGTVPDKDTEVFIFHDGAYYNTLAAAITKDTTGGYDALFKLVLSASEMQGEVIDVILHPTDARFRDMHIQVRTVQRLGRSEHDASQMTAGTSALKLTGNATGKSIEAAQDIYTAGKLETVGNLAVGGNLAITGNLSMVNLAPTGNLAVTGNITAAAMTLTGALTASSIVGVLTSMVLRNATAQTATGVGTEVKLDSSANANNDYYNNALILITGGTGSGQARIITDYVGSTKVATVNRAWQTNPTNDSTFVIVPGMDVWSTSPSAELDGTAVIATATFASMIQALYERFFFLHTLTSTSLTIYKANGTDILLTQTVDDTGTLQTIGKASTM